jgi:hypothetical protein
MTTPYESGRLILKLFELRRDPLLREARDWFLRSFHPDSVDDVVAVLAGEHEAKYRMVLGYWDMAATMVGQGACDREMFLDANPEIWATFAKVHHLLDGLREVAGDPRYLHHLEKVVTSVPGAAERMETLRKQYRALGEGAPAGGTLTRSSERGSG